MSIEFNRNFNICSNLGLYCISTATINGGIRLNCILNEKNKNNESTKKGFPISVNALYKTCDIDRNIDYSKQLVNVWGGITASEYKTRNGEIKSGITIFADKIIIRKSEQSNKDYNIIENIGLYCMSKADINNGIRLNCMLNGKKKEDGKYQKGVPISVILLNEKCNYKNEIKYEEGFVNIWGDITSSEYTTAAGNTKYGLTIFANSICTKKA